MRIAVFGTGAIGGYIGGRLARAGHDVSFIGPRSAFQARGDRQNPSSCTSKVDSVLPADPEASSHAHPGR